MDWGALQIVARVANLLYDYSHKAVTFERLATRESATIINATVINQ